VCLDSSGAKPPLYLDPQPSFSFVGCKEKPCIPLYTFACFSTPTLIMGGCKEGLGNHA